MYMQIPHAAKQGCLLLSLRLVLYLRTLLRWEALGIRDLCVYTKLPCLSASPKQLHLNCLAYSSPVLDS